MMLRSGSLAVGSLAFGSLAVCLVWLVWLSAPLKASACLGSSILTADSTDFGDDVGIKSTLTPEDSDRHLNTTRVLRVIGMAP